MQFDESTIGKLVSDVYSSMLGISTGPHEAATKPLTGRHVTACVQITGEWTGAVMLECPGAITRRWAAAMFGVDPETASSSEINDALGELANMIGGGIKGLVPGACQLSLPTVAEGESFELRIPGGKEIKRMGFACEGEAFMVRIVEGNR